jgi:hypothetical protein
MNTGLQDAYNLGWKLALVGKGRAGFRCSIRTRRSACRSPNACSIRPIRMFRVIVSDSALAGVLRSKVIARIAAFLMS